MTSSDWQSLRDSANLELQLESAVEDGGTYSSTQVRALSRGAFCSTASVMFSHGQPIPDSGIRCQK